MASMTLLINVEGKKDNDNGGMVEIDVETPCHLCEGGLLNLKWPDTYVNQNGTTCAQHLVNIYPFEPRAPKCIWEIIKFRQRCCTAPVEPDPIEQLPDYDPLDYEGNGDDDLTCNICWSGIFPTHPAMVIAMLDIGNGGAASCEDFFYIGQDGLIPKHLCETIQFFAYEPCGCDVPPPTTSNNNNPTGTQVNADDGRVVNEEEEEDTVDTSSPTSMPSNAPSVTPSTTPSTSPSSDSPSMIPSSSPSSGSPSELPSNSPSDRPSSKPSSTPSESPSEQPSNKPITTTTPTAEDEDNQSSLPQRREPYSDGKDSLSIAGRNGRGGSGGWRSFRRKKRHLLKGQ